MNAFQISSRVMGSRGSGPDSGVWMRGWGELSALMATPAEQCKHGVYHRRYIKAAVSWEDRAGGEGRVVLSRQLRPTRTKPLLSSSRALHLLNMEIFFVFLRDSDLSLRLHTDELRLNSLLSCRYVSPPAINRRRNTSGRWELVHFRSS